MYFLYTTYIHFNKLQTYLLMNILLDFIFVADPTSVEYNGRLYVYGTNDTQQLDSVGKDGKNTYQYIPFTGHAVHR